MLLFKWEWARQPPCLKREQVRADLPSLCSQRCLDTIALFGFDYWDFILNELDEEATDAALKASEIADIFDEADVLNGTTDTPTDTKWS
jgi:hypothetical protein